MPRHHFSGLSVDEAAHVLGCSPQTVRRLLQTGHLAGRKLGREWVVWFPTEPAVAIVPARQARKSPPALSTHTTAAIRQRLREVGALLIEVGNHVTQARKGRGQLFLTWRTPHALRVTLAIGRESPTRGWSPYALGVELPFWLAERAHWRKMMPLLRQYEQIRSWCAPRLLRIPGVSEVVLTELCRVEAALRVMAETAPDQALSSRGRVQRTEVTSAARYPETGMITPWAWHLITWLKSYAEVSPSGTGVKIFLQATLPGSGVNKYFLEIYDRGRFFTVTGWHVPGTPCTIEPRQPRIEALYAVHYLLDTGLQRYGERFSLLLAGHWEQVQRVPGTPTYRSHSEADLALCALLATVGATGEQIDTCIRLSGLYRPKWDEKHGTHTYGAMTIAKALRRRDGPPHTVSQRLDVPQQRQRALRQDNAAAALVSWEPPVPFHDFALPAFPIAALPERLQHYVMALAQATQTPCDLAGTLVLAVCACALAKKVVVCIRPGYIEPVNLFMAVVLPPGNRKSTVFAAVMELIQAFEAAETQRMEPYIAAAESQRRIAEKTLQQVEVRASKAESTTERLQLMAEAEALARDLATLRVPARPRLITDDTTPERLVTLLSLHGGRMAVMSPEGGEVFDHLRGRYTPNHLPNFGVYLKGHTGDTLRVDRVNRPAEYVQQPALTVALTMQPEVLHGLMDKAELRGRGLLGRFLYAMPASLLGRRRTDVPPVPETIRHAYSITITRLLTLACDTDDPGQPVAHILQLALMAGSRLQQFAAWLEPQLGPFGELGSMTDWAGKLVGAVARLTGILHMVEHADGAAPWEIAISLDSVERAIALGQYFLQHARAAYAEMGTDPVMADAKYVLEWSRLPHPVTHLCVEPICHAVTLAESTRDSKSLAYASLMV